LSAGNEAAAARWVPVLDDMGDTARAKCWGMLVLALPNLAADAGEIDNFIDEDESEGRYRSGLLVAGLAGLGKISAQQVGQLSGQLELGLGRTNAWTGMIDEASRRRQAGTATVLAAVGMQSPGWKTMPPLHLFHLINALRRNGLETYARMIAAEGLART